MIHNNRSLLYVSYSWNFRHRLVRLYWYNIWNTIEIYVYIYVYTLYLCIYILCVLHVYLCVMHVMYDLPLGRSKIWLSWQGGSRSMTVWGAEVSAGWHQQQVRGGFAKRTATNEDERKCSAGQVCHFCRPHASEFITRLKLAVNMFTGYVPYLPLSPLNLSHLQQSCSHLQHS